MGGNIVADYSLPSFGDNFSGEGIKNTALAQKLEEAVFVFSKAVFE